MKEPTLPDFAARLKRVERAQFKRELRHLQRSAAPRIWGRSVLVLVILLLVVKALLVANLPSGRLNAEVLALRSGTLGQQAVGYLLQPDPVTGQMARMLRLP